MRQRVVLVGMLVVLFSLRVPTLLSRAWSNAGLVILARVVLSGSVQLSLQTVAKAEEMLGQAVLWKSSNLGAHRGLGIVYTISRRPQEALQEWRAGVPAEKSEMWAYSLWYRAGTALEPGVNGGITKEWCEGEYFVLDSFSSVVAWEPCPWCENVPGHFFGVRKGVLEMRYRNIPRKRSGFSYIYVLNVPVAAYSELLIRLKGKPGTVLVMETVVDGTRSRTFNYQPVPQEWEVWITSISGDNLNQIGIGIWELEPVAIAEEYQLFVDWIALR